MRNGERAGTGGDLLSQEPEHPVPLFRGSEIVTEGYYKLEDRERNQALGTMSQHPEPVELWYHSITLYFRGITGQFDFSGVSGDKTLLRMRNIQSLLLGLGISTAKASLDALLAGYYSVAFAAIRHMIETFVQCHYVEVKPDEADRWYDEGDLHKPRKTPRCVDMIDALKSAEGDNQERRAAWEWIYGAWDSMSKGSHPTGEGFNQTVDAAESPRFIAGPTYNRKLCLLGFDHGLWAVDGLVHVLSQLKAMNDEWMSDRTLLSERIFRWREALQAEQRPPTV